MRRSKVRSLICVWLASSIAVGGCRAPATTPVKPAAGAPPALIVVPPPATAGGRATIAIDDAAAAGVLTSRLPDARSTIAGAVVAPLSANDTRALLQRLEPLPDLTAQHAAAPSLRAPSAPPPRSGTPRPIAFVVPTGKAVGDPPPVRAAVRGPLTPPQISPEGEVGVDSEIRIRFDEPMVPVASLGSVATPQVTIVPAVPGTWRWIDTRVLTFTTAAKRFPMASELTVTVAAGVRALSGAQLAMPAVTKFQTFPVAISEVSPRSSLRPDSPIVVTFNQDVDLARITPLLRVVHGKRMQQQLAFRAITVDEARPLWRRNPVLAPDTLATQASPGRHVILAPVTAWPAGSALQVVLGVGAPSREGPRLATRESSVRFDVVPAFQVEGVSCGDMPAPRMTGARCPVKSYLGVQLTTRIAETSYRSSKLQIEGQPFEDHVTSGSEVRLWTPEIVGRTHAIAISDDLVDIYGQRLVGPRRPTFVTTRARYEPHIEVAQGLILLDPRFEIPQWVIEASAVRSLHVALYAVQPEDYFAYEAWQRGDRKTPPGRRVFDKAYAVGARHGATLRTDLRPALGASGLGHVLAVLTAEPAQQRRWFVRKRAAWIQVTRLGATARMDGEQLSAWVQDITPRSSFLAPITGAKASLLVEDGRSTGAASTSDPGGHVTLALPPPRPRKPHARPPTAMLQVQTAGDSMFIAIDDAYERAIRHDRARWYVTDDRFTYKPGEKVFVKGWVRWTHDGVNPELARPAAGDSVSYTLVDPRGNKLASGTAELSDQGGFDVAVDLPPNVNLGTSSFTFSTRQSTHRHPISIQEFRTPPYAVTLDDDVTHSGATPLVLGERIEMRAAARYYSGGGLPGAHIVWDATLRPASYQPPGWDAFSFERPGPRTWQPRHARRTRVRADGGVTLREQASLTGDSTAAIELGLAALPGDGPSVLAVDATVTDVDRMIIRASSRPILVHPSTYYVGLRLRPRTTHELEVIVTDIDGEPVTGVPIEVELEGVLGSERYREDAHVIDTQRCMRTSAAAAVTCPVPRKDDKTAYRATARIADARGRGNAAQYDVPWYAQDDRVDLAIVPDRASYRPGQVAKLDIRSRTFPATAIVSFARQGLIAQRRIDLTAASTIVELPIAPGHLQNVHVLVDRTTRQVHPRDGSALPLAEHLSAAIDLPVELESARLTMRTRPLRRLVEPGARATFEVEVTHDGKPAANAEVALIVVDEAILALSGSLHADPLAPFYRQVGDGTGVLSSIHLLDDAAGDLDGRPGFTRFALDDGGGFGFGASGFGAGGGGLRGRVAASPSLRMGTAIVRARKDFRPTAVFSPRLRTDATGKVRLTVTMPDSLTRFRIVALASSGTHHFGKAESTIVTQRKVNARTVAPRFLNQGDTFSLPVVVQNLDLAPRTVDVAVRAANLTSIGEPGRRLTIPGGQRAEVRFEFATQARGRAVIQSIVTSGDFADASNVELPVYAPATTESFATYGTVDDAPQFERLEVPADVFPDVGGVEVELASTQLQSLTDAFWYLYGYPHECAEQRSGRMLATAAVADILEAFATPGRPSRQEIEQTVLADIKQLTKDQLRDGGWGYFNGMHADPFVTTQVLSALAAHRVQGPVIAKAIAFVTKLANAMLARLEKSARLPALQRLDRSGHGYEVALAATTLAALAAAGVDVHARAIRLDAVATRLAAYPIDAKARVLALLAGRPAAQEIRARLLRDLLSATHETAAAATVTTKYDERERLLLVSSNRTTALALDALIREAPQHALVAKLARGVLDAREHGRWRSTQENVVVLATLRRYFDTYEKVTPSYTGKLWFGGVAYAEQAFIGRSTDRATASVGWPTLHPGSAHDLSLAKTGAGRMYYRIGITYAPKQTLLPALDAGFIVRRSYTPVDDPGDAIRLPDGSWKIRLGARVVVSVEAINTTLRHAVAIVDPLPAGFEAVNDNLATSERTATTGKDSWWDFRNLRDERSEVFAMQLAAGTHRFSYTARATTPGRFFAAPARAEEMYSPETFGRSTGHTVLVE